MAAPGPSDEPASRTGLPVLRRARAAVCRRGAVAGSRRGAAEASTGIRGGNVQEAVALVAESVAEQIIRQPVPGVVVRNGMLLLILALEIRAEADIQVQLSIPSKVGSGQAGGAHWEGMLNPRLRGSPDGTGRSGAPNASKLGYRAGRGAGSLRAVLARRNQAQPCQG